ncbi:hypothetical protein I5Q34_08290 [Streptomyces sp. AV19]|uniref:hypothetical protein n=1 Tax=Streptomyces sp. AV19 TaxID=2793068 RepID=UPI0018FE4FEF|nr:hypothetical protein [Streptomyces sp. AV19]MBH1934293.1 hypothetical protein [Streptomyces sp. AV19]MDG4533398.1 hypothetical protein [Streptomyces sp. AV19]
MSRMAGWVRRWGSVVVALGLTVAGATGASAHAREEKAAVSCAGSNTIDFSPGLSLAPRKTRIGGEGAYRCTSTVPGLTSAKSVISGGGTNGCFTSEATTVEEITWSTGEKSAVTYPLGNVRQIVGQAVVLVMGKVVSGKFAGRAVFSPGVQLTLDVPACAMERGVRRITGPSVLLIP